MQIIEVYVSVLHILCALSSVNLQIENDRLIPAPTSV